MKIAVIGGTGPQGRGLAYRLALGGHDITIGSRDAGRAKEKAQEIADKAGAVSIDGADNMAAAGNAEIVLLAVPFDGHTELVSALAPALAEKVVISCVNPLGFDESGPYALDVTDGSAAEEAQRLVPTAQVVGAFHHVSAMNLWKHEGLLADEDILVCGNHEPANELVASLAPAITGHQGVIAGGLRLARELEPLTGVLISINKRFKVRSGIRITGLS